MTTCTPAPAPRSATVFSRRLELALVSGAFIMQRYGVYAGQLARPAILTVRRAATGYVCVACGHQIPRGTLHGSNTGTHYCGCCITTDEPESVFTTGKAA